SGRFSHQRRVFLAGFARGGSPSRRLVMTTQVSGPLCGGAPPRLEGQLAPLHWPRRAPAPASRKAGSGYQNQEHSMPHNTSRLEAIATIGIDIGKNTFHVVGLDRNGAIVLRQKLSRRQVEARPPDIPPCLLSMAGSARDHT